VILDAKESKSVSHDLGTLNYMASALSGWQADYPDDQDWYDIFITGSGNQFSGWSDSTYDQAVKTGDSSADANTRASSYATAEKELDSQAPVSFIFQNENLYLLSPKVKGIQTTPLDDYWYGDVASATTQYIAA
jgi:oligopeptide transport system substrate-binding protein